MKYTIRINQYLVTKFGFSKYLDVIDLAIVDYLRDFVLYPDAKRIVYDGVGYIWLNYRHLLASMPVLGIQNISGVSRRIAKLRGLGLIRTVKMSDNSLYYAFSPLGYSLFFDKKLSTSLALNQYPSCFSARAPLALAQEHNNKQSINNKQSAILKKEKEKLIIKRKRNFNAKAFLENRNIKNREGLIRISEVLRDFKLKKEVL
ncbi:MAG: hypothetical protein NZ601_03130 [candidate division WOR-3 bacterium]|nr:hypothetical protein [candidate division WOR-3 bacterium]